MQKFAAGLIQAGQLPAERCLQKGLDSRLPAVWVDALTPTRQFAKDVALPKPTCICCKHSYI